MSKRTSDLGLGAVPQSTSQEVKGMRNFSAAVILQERKKKKQACLRYPHNLDFVTELLSIIAYIATIYTKFFQF